MASYFCKSLNNDIMFYKHKINACCSGYGTPTLYEFNSSELDIEKMLCKKEEMIEQYKNGIVETGCLKCPNLQSYNGECLSTKFRKLIINHYLECNCDCIYCTRKLDTPVNKENRYHLLPNIKKMYDMNLFENELEIEFQGGDIGALKEFIPLINEFELHGKHFYRFLTNNIVYYDEISKFLNEKRAQLCVSVDSGTQETYARIKGVDKFNVVVENLQRYIANSPELPNIILKYILLPSYNDNEYEMSKFIEMIKSLGMYFVIFDLDYRDIMIKSDKKFEIPQSYYESKTLFENIAKKYSISVAIPEYTQDILNRGSF